MSFPPPGATLVRLDGWRDETRSLGPRKLPLAEIRSPSEGESIDCRPRASALPVEAEDREGSTRRGRGGSAPGVDAQNRDRIVLDDCRDRNADGTTLDRELDDGPGEPA